MNRKETNTGDYNTGYRNTGHCNTGHYNTGDRNTGHYNTGYRNTGHYNTGHYNTGHYNTGDCNTGYRNTGDCNTTNPPVRLFNKDSGWKFGCEEHIKFRSIIHGKLKPLCEWVSKINMSDKEKEDYPHYKTTGGYLKVNQDLFNGNDFTDEEIKFLESVPNFCPKIFLECTGLDINNNKKKIVIDGKEILVSKESFEAIKKQFIED